MTTLELAVRIGLGFDATAELLAELEHLGQAERHGKGWRLSSTAEHRYGQALRGLLEWLDDSAAEFASHRPAPDELDVRSFAA